MNEQVAKDWVAALRSGKYTQGSGGLKIQERLSSPVTHCCLGVLCEISPFDAEVDSSESLTRTVWGWSERNVSPGFDIWDDWDSDDDPSSHVETSVLPLPVMDWAGMHDRCGVFTETGHSETSSLTVLNDAGTPFSKIADLIEEHWESL